MSATQLVTYITWGFYLVVFVVTTHTALRAPRRANIDIALFFSVPALSIALSTAATLGLYEPSPFSNAVSGALTLLLAFVILRLVDDFAPLPRWLMALAGGGWVALILPLFLIPPPRPLWLSMVQTLYFISLQGYAALAFWRESRRAAGVTGRRMRAAAWGSLVLGGAILFSAMRLLLPAWQSIEGSLFQLGALASGFFYFIGFAPPSILRHAWQEPELRAFLGRAARLPRLPTTQAIIQELEQGAASAIGAPRASIGLYDPDKEVLVFEMGDQRIEAPLMEETSGARTFRTQQPLFSFHAHPKYQHLTQKYGAEVVLAAPITAGERRLGILSVYAPRAPIFAQDDLELVQLLADQAAVILESRALIDEAVRVRAREEATRLKDDFLSVAAHDLKTPLTTIVGQAQLLARRADRDPSAPADLDRLKLIGREAERLRTLVMDLLDASRAEQGKLVGKRHSVDLGALVQDGCERYLTTHPYHLEVVSLIGEWDGNRLQQLLQNLLENAAKYSTDGTPIQVGLRQEGEFAHLTVQDQGIGIPQADLPHIFDRFHRAQNVDDRRHMGMGLGLFISRSIVEQHGGRIWATSRPDHGSTFHVLLPLGKNGVSP